MHDAMKEVKSQLDIGTQQPSSLRVVCAWSACVCLCVPLCLALSERVVLRLRLRLRLRFLAKCPSASGLLAMIVAWLAFHLCASVCVFLRPFWTLQQRPLASLAV